MTSLNASHQLNYRHMYDVADLHSVEESKVVPTKGTILHAIMSNNDFSFFQDLVKRGKMEEYLNDPVLTATLFLPTDRSFERLPSHVIRQLESKSPRDVVAFHILKAPVSIISMKGIRQYFETVHPRENLLIEGRTPMPKIGHRHQSTSVTPSINYEPSIIEPDILMENGIIHIINSPLVPEA